MIEENLDLNMLRNFSLGERGSKYLFSSLTLHNIMPIVLLNDKRKIKRYAVEPAIISTGKTTGLSLSKYMIVVWGSSR
ncbi:MAG: hypothetical protein WCI49_08095 [Ferruginibacter sp.]